MQFGRQSSFDDGDVVNGTTPSYVPVRTSTPTPTPAPVVRSRRPSSGSSDGPKVCDWLCLLMLMALCGAGVYMAVLGKQYRSQMEKTSTLAGWRFCRDSEDFCDRIDRLGQVTCFEWCVDESIVVIRNTTRLPIDWCVAFLEDERFCPVVLGPTECRQVRTKYQDYACDLAHKRNFWHRSSDPLLVLGLLVSILFGAFVLVYLLAQGQANRL